VVSKKEISDAVIVRQFELCRDRFEVVHTDEELEFIAGFTECGTAEDVRTILQFAAFIHTLMNSARWN
jgi:hypothetical protein